MKKDQGTGIIYYIFFLFLISVICVLASYVIKIKQISILNEKAQDAVSLSNMASALIDINQYEQNGIIQIKDFNTSFAKYLDAIKYNMNLQEDMRPKEGNVLISEIEIIEYSVYNVVGDNIILYRIHGNSGISEPDIQVYSNQRGILKTPDEVIIHNSAIYSKIGFHIKGFGKQTHYVSKEGSVDVLGNDR